MDPTTSPDTPGTPRVLGIATGASDEDPFGPGDPLEVARLVRRALATAGRRAVDVGGLVVVVDRAPPPGTMARFVRRALGPHGATVPARLELVEPAIDHPTRRDIAERAPVPRGQVLVCVVLGPASAVSACCLGRADREVSRRTPEQPDPFSGSDRGVG